ncbi:amidase [Rhodalgimonas zhirmunskyi]|uniref:Amidase n=1 Tax=Rhodalgimonas zhirmunskyi TaxID=2964767 RepID=A0AAJ1UBZ6_9RHOB|nr:amidase [Rhodoalgimonas zhirmunskyi]MDQ2093117.1 amidase [Rhodoalgimonas zhirmunskyi]
MTVTNQNDCALAHTLDMGEDGLRVAIKDCIDIKGMVSACGSAALKDSAPATTNAAVVDNILTHGCKIIGKANMHELAYGMTGVNAVFGTPVNPKWPDRIPGGSSSGSAVAVAAGRCDFAIGTDTGGSVRQPAICCGVYGIKPTFGRVSRDGCHPKESSLDCVGVFARTAAMLTKGMEAIDPTFKRQLLTKAPRLARVKSTVEKKLGDALVYALMEGLPDAAYVTLPHMEAAFDAGMTVIGAETVAAFGPLVDAGKPLGADIRSRLLKAHEITDENLRSAEDIRATFTSEVDAIFEDYDVLVTPALPVIPPTLSEAEDPATVLPLTKLLRPFNLSGHPAIVLPISVGPDHLPAGIQIIGRKGEDAFLCATAEWLTKTLSVFQTASQPEDTHDR